MATITRTHTFSAGAVIVAAQFNTNENTIYNEFNGNIDNDNIKSSAAIVATKLNLATIAQTMAMSSAAINEAKGSDVASATTTDIGAATGNYIDVTGTTTITGLGTVQAGTRRTVKFTGALILTHNATSLILPTAANITTVANDRATFVSLGSGNWICTHYQRADGSALVVAAGGIVQTVKTTYATYASLGTTAIPLDDTIPTWAEGSEVSGLQTAITPTSNSNYLIIDAVAYISSDADNSDVVTFCVFNGPTGTDPAIGVSCWSPSNASHFGPLGPSEVRLRHILTSPGTSALTFKFRFGGNSASDTWVINGKQAATAGRIYGGVLISSVVIHEIKV